MHTNSTFLLHRHRRRSNRSGCLGSCEGRPSPPAARNIPAGFVLVVNTSSLAKQAKTVPPPPQHSAFVKRQVAAGEGHPGKQKIIFIPASAPCRRADTRRLGRTLARGQRRASLANNGRPGQRGGGVVRGSKAEVAVEGIWGSLVQAIGGDGAASPEARAGCHRRGGSLSGERRGGAASGLPVCLSVLRA